MAASRQPLPSPFALLLHPLVAGADGQRLDIVHSRAHAVAATLVEQLVVRLRDVARARPGSVVESDAAAAGPAAQEHQPGVAIVIVKGRGVQRHVTRHDPTLRDHELRSGGAVRSGDHPRGRRHGGGRDDGGRRGRRRGLDDGRAELPVRASRTRAPDAVHAVALAAAATGDTSDLAQELVHGRDHGTIGIAEGVAAPLPINPDDLAARDGDLGHQPGLRLGAVRALRVVEADTASQVTLAGTDQDVALDDRRPLGDLPPAADVFVAHHGRGERQVRRERRARGMGPNRRRRQSHTRGHGGHRGLAGRVVRVHRTERIVDDRRRDRRRAESAHGRGRGVADGRRRHRRGRVAAQARVRRTAQTEPLAPHRRRGNDDRGVSALTALTTRTTGSAGASLTTTSTGTTRATASPGVVAAGVGVGRVVTAGPLAVGLRRGAVVVDLLTRTAPRESVGDTLVGEPIGVRVDAAAVVLVAVPDDVRAAGVRLDAGPTIGHDGQLDAHQREVAGERAGDRLHVLRRRRDGGVADRTGLIGRDQRRTEVVEALLNRGIVGEAVARVLRVRAHLRAVDRDLDLGAALADLDQGGLHGVPQLLERVEVQGDDVAGGHGGHRSGTRRARDRRSGRDNTGVSCTLRSVPGLAAGRGEREAHRHEGDEQRHEGVSLRVHVVSLLFSCS